MKLTQKQKEELAMLLSYLIDDIELTKYKVVPVGYNDFEVEEIELSLTVDQIIDIIEEI